MQKEPAFETANAAIDVAKTKLTSDAIEYPVASTENRKAQVSCLGLLLAISLTGTVLLAIFHAQRTIKLHRWIKRAGASDVQLEESCATVACALNISQRVQCCLVDTRTTPLLWPWGLPLIAMPRELFDSMDAEQRQNIIAHEMAHLLRRDHWANLFVFMVKLLFWWNPVAWWADRELRAAQELCCDAIAINCCQANRQRYASALLKALDFIAEPQAPHPLVPGMGSRRSILRRFEMIGETRISYHLSRWTLLFLLALAVSLAFKPIRAQEKSDPKEAPEIKKMEYGHEGKMLKRSMEGSQVAMMTAPQMETIDMDSTQKEKRAEDESVDSSIRELGREVLKRISNWSDEAVLALKDNETGRMKVEKNLTPIAEILVTAHLNENGSRFDLEGVDDNGEVIVGSKTESRTIHDGNEERFSLRKSFVANEREVLSKIQLTPRRLDGNTVVVDIKALFTYPATREEIIAMNQVQGKYGAMNSDFMIISRSIIQYRLQTGAYPAGLGSMKQDLPKDIYSINGEDYHYEPQQSRFILSSCGKDGIYGNEDDWIYITGNKGNEFRIIFGNRYGLYPLDNE
jgi:beta-lactamase regulating signal transducer with metallopeptidase domain